MHIKYDKKIIHAFFVVFSSLTFENDVGLVELATKIVYDRFKSPVALAQPDAQYEGLQVYQGLIQQTFFTL